MVKTLSYVLTTGELAGMVYADDAAPAQAFTYTLTGRLASVTDAAGTRAFSYNEYDELVSDCLTADEIPHLITENRDGLGRSIGFAYSKAGVAASAEQYGYGTDGRLVTAAFSHGGENKQFGYAYLPGTHLLQTLTMPNGMTLTQQYETQRDLLTGMEYKRGTSGVVERYYSYDALGRPITRQENRQGGSRNDAFTHNDRSELTAATLGNTEYTYSYDNIGNRKTAQENAEEATAYTSNQLNQYTAVGSFAPSYDADGNQTKVQTSSGIWEVTYNAENRPVIFSRTNEDGTVTKVSCTYDYMGRRATKKVETVGANAATASTNLHQRYIYRNFLQIACCDLTRESHPNLWLITWDPTQPIATRPLALRKDGTWYCYGWDLTKNICEVFSNEGYLNNTVTYSYTPYGTVTAEGNVQQPIQWSSEFYDEELGLVYYNYRHYNFNDGRWLNRDAWRQAAYKPMGLYGYVKPITQYDYLGMVAPGFGLNPQDNNYVSDLQKDMEVLSNTKPEGPTSYVPVLGSWHESLYAFGQGGITEGSIHLLLGVSDIFLIKSLVTIPGKLVFKSGSHTWRATRRWYGKKFNVPKGYHVHHWLLHRNQGIGKYFPDFIKNQPWNLKVIWGETAKKSFEIHVKDMHGGTLLKKIVSTYQYGLPDIVTRGTEQLFLRTCSWLVKPEEEEKSETSVEVKINLEYQICP